MSSRELISLLLLTAKCVLARVWKLSKIASVKDWYNKVWDLVIADKLLEGIFVMIYHFITLIWGGGEIVF